MLIKERDYPIIEQIGRHLRSFAIIELGERQLAIDIQKGLPVNTPLVFDSFRIVKSVPRAAITGHSLSNSTYASLPALAFSNVVQPLKVMAHTLRNIERTFRVEPSPNSMKFFNPAKQLPCVLAISVALSFLAPLASAQSDSAPGTAGAAGSSSSANQATSPAQPQTAVSPAATNGSSATTPPHSTDSGTTPPSTSTTENPSGHNDNSISGANPASK